MFASSKILIGSFFIISYGHGIMFSIRLFFQCSFLMKLGFELTEQIQTIRIYKHDCIINGWSSTPNTMNILSLNVTNILLLHFFLKWFMDVNFDP